MTIPTPDQLNQLHQRHDQFLDINETRFLHQPDGLLYNWINAHTQSPFTPDQLPQDIVYRCRPGMPDALTFINNENTIYKMGHYLSAMSIAYQLTAAPRFLTIAQRCLDTLDQLFQLTAQLYGETGWLPKAFGWLPKAAYSHDMNFDQAGPVIGGMLDYLEHIDPNDPRPRQIIQGIADMLIRWDYNVHYPGTLGMTGGKISLLDTPNINEQVPILQLLLIAARVTNDDRYIHEYQRLHTLNCKGNLLNYTRVQMAQMLKAGTLPNAQHLTDNILIMPPMPDIDRASLPAGENPDDYVQVGGGWHQSFEAGRYLALHDPDQKRRDHYRNQLMRWFNDEIACTYDPQLRAGYLHIYYNPHNGKYHRVTPRLLDTPKIRRNFLSYCRGTWLHLGDLWALGALDTWELTRHQPAADLVLDHLVNARYDDFLWIKDPYTQLPPPSEYLGHCDFGPTLWLLVYWRARQLNLITPPPTS